MAMPTRMLVLGPWGMMTGPNWPSASLFTLAAPPLMAPEDEARGGATAVRGCCVTDAELARAVVAVLRTTVELARVGLVVVEGDGGSDCEVDVDVTAGGCVCVCVDDVVSISTVCAGLSTAAKLDVGLSGESILVENVGVSGESTSVVTTALLALVLRTKTVVAIGAAAVAARAGARVASGAAPLLENATTLGDGLSGDARPPSSESESESSPSSLFLLPGIRIRRSFGAPKRELSLKRALQR